MVPVPLAAAKTKKKREVYIILNLKKVRNTADVVWTSGQESFLMRHCGLCGCKIKVKQCKWRESVLTSLQLLRFSFNTQPSDSYSQHGSSRQVFSCHMRPVSSSGLFPAKECPVPSFLRPRCFLQPLLTNEQQAVITSLHLFSQWNKGISLASPEEPQLRGSILTRPIPRACASRAFVVQNRKISYSILM